MVTTQSKPESSGLDMSKYITPWKLDPQQPYLLKNCRIVDPVHGSISSNATIALSAGKIISVEAGEPAKSDSLEIKTENIIDLEGKYVCPGLIDCHVHIAVTPGAASLASYRDMTETKSLLRQPSVLKSMLQRGFTTVRDCGGATLAMKEAVEEGIYPGPRLFISGKALSQTGGHGDMRGRHDTIPCCGGAVSGISRIVDGVPECYRVARDELRQGADFIKIMGGGGVASPTDRIDQLQFSDDEIKAIVTVANNAKTYVTSHCYTTEAVTQAINQGVRGIEHGNLIDLETAKLMADTGTFLTPTLVTHFVSKESHFLDAESEAKVTTVLEQGLVTLKMATEVGVTVCFGTDLLGPTHFAQSKEFSIRSQVQTSLQILQSATINAAKLLGQENKLGQVKEGFMADLLILDRNPLDDITILDKSQESILAVVKDGRVMHSHLSYMKEEPRV
ncbi:amidohydrolase [Colletotrichum abscissum]|uniref:Amidohydrolase n=1 Tax=Colletotrichum abscissum TaxID=1671311 RepID=A0A9P9X0C8_9PEZI|nr:amidohydrolase [Colletotrichum abscissum]KAI3529318.1 amidohydrolase [Colletotrichum abscissum]KAK1505120.1 amidohydrolase [Colletotrichum abscissum]